jgi:asparagine synthase (glutamine-hydrolysing)
VCGIAGWIDWEADLTRQGPAVSAMAETLACRGPDASGLWLSPRAAFGHRRLVVIDPAGGAQPMVRERGGHPFVITYNGELYNTDEVRRDLEGQGYAFRSRCDTEVVLVAYMAWGPSCVERLNGIFAFGVWDGAEERLFLARDRLGVKPLFYAQLRRGLLFGSEPKALLAHPAVRAEVDEEGLTEVFFLAPSRTPGHGVYRGMEELRPGHCLVFDRRGLRRRRYWQLESRPHADGPRATAHRVRELLEDAVTRQLVSDVPICTLLSGGLDSSAVSAFAARSLERQGRGPLRTFSVDFADQERHFESDRFYPDPDGPWVRRVSAFLGTAHHRVVLDTPQQVEHLETAVRARDFPGYADVDASLYLFCREVKRHATVALSGEAADEVFGGYPWFHTTDAAVVGDTFPWVRMVPERFRLLAPELRARLRPQEYLAERCRQTLAEVPLLEGEGPAERRVRELFYLNLTWFLTALLDRKDRMSMAVGLEVRVPFCDHRLVEYVWNIPWSLKCWDGRPKGILRLALQGVLPEDVLARRKSPYPKTYNPDYLNAVRTRLLRVLADPTSPLVPLLDVAAVRQLVAAAPATGGPTWFGQTMGLPQLFAYLIQVDAWLRAYRVSVRIP